VLVPSSPGAANAWQTPQKLSGDKDVQFFTAGNLGGRTLVIYVKKRNASSSWSRSTRPLAKDAPHLDSVFRVLEPVIGKINEKMNAQPTVGSRFVPTHRGRLIEPRGDLMTRVGEMRVQG